MERRLLKRFHEKVPIRYLLCLLSFLGLFNLFTLRTNIAISLVAMTGVTENDNDTSNDCPAQQPEISSISNDTFPSRHFFAWTQKQQGLLLSSYFIGFTVTQLVGGVLSNLFQAKWVAGLGILGSAVFSLVAPPAAYAGYWTFFAVRFLTGLSSGVALASIYSLLGRWTPLHERGLILSIVYTGTSWGAIVAQFCSGYIIATMNQNGEGWTFPFYIFGAIGVLWFIAWSLLVYNSPEHHVAISEKELSILNQDLENQYTEEGVQIPWISILTSIPFWALVGVNISHNWGLDLFQMQLPNFFKNTLHLSIEKNGLYSSLPFILKTIVGSLSGTVSTWIEVKFKPSINSLRKFFTLISYVGAGGILLGAGYDCSESVNLSLLSLAMGIFGFYSVGPNCTCVDMSPKYSGIILGMSNTISNIAGFICPLITADIVSRKQSLQNWRYVFLIASCLYIGSAIIFLFFGSSKLQPWAEGKRKEPQRGSDK